MTKISRYVIDDKVTGSDKWIGSDAQTQYSTKNFTPTKLAVYFNENQVIDIGTPIRYRYDILEVGDSRLPGTITFNPQVGTPYSLSNISSFILSKYTLKGNDVTQYLNFLIGANVLIYKADDINIFGLYKVVSLIENIDEPLFFDVTLEYITGNGSIVEDKDYLISLVSIPSDVIPTRTSELINDGEDGVHPFITAEDVPAQVNSDWNATSGVAEILNKPTNTSDFTNDGADGINPFITAEDIPTALAFTSPLVNTAGTVTINQSGSTTDGYLSSIDWNTFNNKQEALLGTGFVKSTAGVISYDTNTYYLASNPNGFITSAALTGYVPYTGATGPVNLGNYNLTVYGITVGRGSGNDTNTAVGILALPSSITGTFNTAIGRSALTSNTSGSGNTAIGTSTLFLNTGGSNNVAVGFSSILYNSSGNNNTAIGYQSLRNNQSGSLNVASGLDALYSNTTGYNNTAFGASALFFNVSSYNNVGIGYNANTLSASNFNSIVIGANAIGAGSNTTVLGNSSITKAVIYGDLGLGTTAPSQKLHVFGNARITGAIYDSSNDSGTLGQVLSSTAIGTDWVTLTDMGLTSVGLSMPVAFTVANTPLTANGTIAVSAAGLASQYIRGDGQLATFPTSGGGGSSVNYYLNGSIPSSVAGYQQMDNEAVVGGGTDFNLTGNGLIAQFLTDIGNPNRTQIPGGAWNFEMFFQVSSAGGNQKFYLELLKYDGINFNLISSSVLIPEEITGGTSIDLYLTSLAVPTTPLLTTDRLAVRVYITDNAVGRTITLHTENTSLCEIITTFSGGVTSLNGLTENTQYLAVGTSGMDFNISSVLDTHTFNLPTASSTNRGALNSSDWITFNSKANASGTTNYVSKFTGTSSLGNSVIYDDGYNVGIGTIEIIPVLSPVERVLKIQSIGASSLYLTTEDFNRNWAITAGSSGKLLFTDINYGFSRMTIDSSGNVGINVLSNLVERLEVGGNALIKTAFIGTISAFGDNYASFSHASRAGTNDYSLLSDNSGITYLNASATKSINFRINNQDKAILDSNGNVGIGTTSPSDKLTINSGGSGTGVKIIGYQAENFIHLNNVLSTDNRTFRLIAGITSVGYDGFSIFDTQANDTRFVISNTGNVGIGITNPTYRLDVNGSINVTAGSAVRWGSGDADIFSSGYSLGFRTWTGAALTEKMRITSSGNVGIGTTSPTTLLDLYSSGGGVSFKTYTSTTNYTEHSYSKDAGFFIDSYQSVAGNPYTKTTDLVANADSGAESQMRFFTATTASSPLERMRITSTGNVGIGTTSPNVGGWDKAITVNGNSNAAYEVTDGTVRTAVFVAGNSIGGLSVETNHPLGLYTNSTERMRITTSGNIGIGTTSPVAKFHIQDTNGGIFFDGSGATYNRLKSTTSSASIGRDLLFSTQNAGTTPDLYITSGGNVGIGITSPANRLDVIGDGIRTSADQSTSAFLVLAGTATEGRITVSSYGGYQPMTLYTGGSERMRITSSGNVGIGTTNPGASLEIDGSFNIKNGDGNITHFNYVDGSTNYIRGTTYFDTSSAYFTGGNVGIGTSSPGAKLDVITESRVSYAVGSEYRMRFTNTDGNGRILVDGNESALIFGTSASGTGSTATERMRITSAGNVGIGTTAPSVKLDIETENTSGIVDGIRIKNRNTANANSGVSLLLDGYYTQAKISSYENPQYTQGGNLLLQTYNGSGVLNTGILLDRLGNVGIGTTSPAAKLQVIGDIATSTRLVTDTINGYTGGGTPITIQTGGIQDIVLGTNNAERMRITSSGNVGIGTTNPGAKLTVNTTTNENVAIGSLSSIPTGRTLILQTSALGGSIETYSSLTSGYENTLINPNGGNVGIGTTSPVAKLEVNGGLINVVTNNPDGVLTEVFRTQITGLTGTSNWRNSIYAAESTNPSNSILKFSLANSQTTQADVMTLLGTGNVGIGTTSPNNKLSISGGSIEIQSGAGKIGFNVNDSFTAYGGSIAHYGMSRANGSEPVAISGYYGVGVFTDGSERMRITNAGNVGIGTTNPTAKLYIDSGTSASGFHVLSSNTTSLRTYLEATAGNVEQHFLFTGNQDWVLGLDKADSNKFKLASADDAFASAKLTVTTAGNVGIGTTSPSSLLHLSKNAELNITLSNTLVGQSSNYGVDGNGAYLISSANTVFYNGGVNERMRITSGGNLLIGTTADAGNRLEVVGTANNWAGSFTGNTTAGQSYGAIVRGGTNSSDVAFNVSNAANSTTYLSVRGDGDVGIGTTNPGAKLEINNSSDSLLDILNLYNTGITGTAAVGKGVAIRLGRSNGNYSTKIATIYEDNNPNYLQPALAFYTMYNSYLNGSEVERMRISANGNVGIGTTSPQDFGGTFKTIEVQGSSGGYILATNSGASTIAQMGVGTGIAYYGLRTSGDVAFTTANAEKMRITSTGNVGIGTTAPASSAILDLTSTTQGFLPPRMTQGHRTAIVSPQLGLCVYCIDGYEGLYIFKSTGWEYVG